MVRNITAEQAKKEREAKRAEERKPLTHWAGQKISDKKVRVKFLSNFVMQDGKECVVGKEAFIAENYIADLLKAEMIELVIEKAINKTKKETR